MKIILLRVCCSSVLAVALLLLPSARCLAQERSVVINPTVTDAVSITAAGNITEVTPGMILIKGAGEVHSTAYITTRNTLYFDDQGAPAQMANVRKGHGVVIYYVKEGDNRVATKIIVRNAP